MFLRGLVGAGVAAGGFLILFSSPALAADHSSFHASQGPPAGVAVQDNNRGRVWVEDSDFDNGNEPQFQCGDVIRILGSKMDDASGTWMVVSWSPSDNGTRLTGTWTYNQAGPDRQVIAVVGTLPAGHYRLDVQQKNTKHKMFWVAGCAAAATGGVQGQAEQATATRPESEAVEANSFSAAHRHGEVGPNEALERVSANGASGVEAAPEAAVAPATVTASTPTGNVLGATASAPSGGVLGAMETAASAAFGGVLAATGMPLALALTALVMIGLGGLVMVVRRRGTF